MCVKQLPSYSPAPLGRDESARGETLGDKPQIYLVFKLQQAAGCCVIFDKPGDAESRKFVKVTASS